MTSIGHHGRAVIAFAAALGLLVSRFPALAHKTPEKNDHHHESQRYAAFGFPLDRCSPQHNVGNIVIGAAFVPLGSYSPPGVRDCFTGEEAYEYDVEYPKKTRITFLSGASLLVGGIVGRDTLVTDEDIWTTAYGQGIWGYGEWTQGDGGTPYIELRSTLDPEAPEFVGAVSEQDYIRQAVDTPVAGRPLDYVLKRPHKPLNLLVTITSYAWSYGYAADFVLFDMQVKNIGTSFIQDAYLALNIVPSGGFSGGSPSAVGGLLRDYEQAGACPSTDTLNILWWADADGDPINGEFIEHPVFVPPDQFLRSVPYVNGIYIISPRTHAGSVRPGKTQLSYNWFFHYNSVSNDFGPQSRAHYRDFGTGSTGTPVGDRNLYHVLSSGEVDYDQIFTAGISQFDATWLYPPPQLAGDIADGISHTHHLVSIGPFQLRPGAALPVAFAYVGSERFHTDPAMGNLLPGQPHAYYNKLDFSGLVTNAKWAERVYDNPGVDTDGDGYRGEFKLCVVDSQLTDTGWVYTVSDTVWYRGDGIPDWRAATPPPAPDFWVTPRANGLHVRFNGRRSETYRDPFLQMTDFEGYRIYIARDSRKESFAMVASYDHDNYDKYVWNTGHYPEPGWELRDIPFTLDSLRCLYGRGDDPCDDADFDPLLYRPTRPYQHPRFPDSLYYFAKHDYNASGLGATTPIRKTYPDAPKPPIGSDVELRPEDFTPDGYLKYYEYEFEIDSLMPLVPYWINVTAFDFGSPRAGLAALETSVTLGAREAFPLHHLDAPISGSGRVYVYPNPYRIDGRYRAEGFEGRGIEDLPDDKVRLLHFANLPTRCTIKIFSLDGDRLITIEHDKDPSDPTAHHDSWNLITRNHQRPVSGLYYWTVETPGGETQIGKFALIM